MSADIIDTNVVQLRFDSQDFVNGVNHSLMAVESLKESLNFDSKSFDSLSRAANNIDLSAVASNIESLSSRFSTFGIVGMTAIQRITNEVMTLAGKLGGLLTKPWRQIVSGGWSRASNIGQAKFQLQGLFGKDEEGLAKLNMTMMATSDQIVELTGLSEDLVVAMNAADYAVADTAYGLDSAAKAASVLATSGVDVLHFSEDLKDANGLMRTEMQVALRSISGVAAMANASYDDIAHVFERVSGNGRIMAIDLQSLSARGLNAAATLRDYLNEIGRTANATEADIREMVSKGEIDFMTFALAMDNAYGDHAKDANETFSGAFSNMKFALSKIGADFITPIRNKMVPLFNDVRIAINNVRKALNFKMKFPGLEEEISIVDAFTNVITNLTSKAHDLFIAWNGGQTVMEKAMSGLSEFTGISLSNIKNVYDEVEKGSLSSSNAVQKLIRMVTESGHDMKDVFHTLSESLGKTEDDIYSMCYNGEISFEEFSNAVSATFGNLVQETRISQLAQIFNNLLQVGVNIASTFTSIVGPAIWAFFQVFSGGGIGSVIGITEAISNFTKRLILSRESQEKVRRVAFQLFTVLKSGIRIVARLASSIFQVLESMAPLLGYFLDFVEALSNVISYIVETIVESQLLSSAVTIFGKIFQVVGFLVINVITTILKLVEPAIYGIGEVFAFLARSIGNIDLGFLEVLIDRFKELISAIANGGLFAVLQNTIGILFYTIGYLFRGLTITFTWLNQLIYNVVNIVASLIGNIVTIIKNFRDTVISTYQGIVEWLQKNFTLEKAIAMVGQLIGFSVLLRFAQGVKGLGQTFSSVARYLNSNAILNFTNSVKAFARAVLEMSVAMVLLSSIPKENLASAIKLFIVVLSAMTEFMIVYYGYQLILNYMNNKIIADPYVKFMNKLSASLNAFMANAGRAAIITSLAVLLISLAASLGFFIKSIIQLNEIDTSAFETGAYRLFLLIGILTAFMGTLALATRSVIGGSNIDSINISSNGMMGAAVVLMALLVVIRAFEVVINEYAGFDPDEFRAGFLAVTAVIFLMASSISMIGLSAKSAGFGMMGSSVAMLGFLIVINYFLDILTSYIDTLTKYDPKEIRAAMFIIAEIILTITAAISVIAIALTTGGGTSFAAALGKGSLFQSNFSSNVPKFIGVIFTLLSLAVVLQSVSLMMAAINLYGIESSISAMFIILTILGGLFASLMAIRNVKAGNIAGIAFVLLELTTILPVLTLYDPARVLAGAIAVSGVVAALGWMFRLMSSLEVTIRQAAVAAVIMGAALAAIAWSFSQLMIFDYAKVYSTGIAMASVLAGFALVFQTMSGATFNPEIIMQMAAMLTILGIGLNIIIRLMPDFDVATVLAFTTSLSLLAVALSGAIRIMSGANLTNATGIFAAFTGIALALSMLVFALVVSTNAMTGSTGNLSSLAGTLILLIPTFAALATIATLMSKFNVSPVAASVLAIIVGLVSGLVVVFGAMASLGDAEATVTLIQGAWKGLLGLIPFIAALGLLSLALGALFSTGFGVPIFAAGLLGIGSILTTIGIFIASITAIATLGDANSAVYMLDNLGVALDQMIPFLFKMGAICAVLGITAPLMIAGAIGFSAVFGVISAFVGMIAAVSLIGNPADTVTLLKGLITAMDHFNDFMTHFVVVLTMMGAIAPLVVVGSMVLRLIFRIITEFAASITVIGQVGNTANTIAVMKTLVDSLRELVTVFSIVMALGALGAAVLTGMILITSSMGMLLGLSFIIGQIGSIREAILNGITTIMLTATTMLEATIAMNMINVGAIANFILGLGLIALAPIHGVAKFAQIASMMMLMGINSNYISKGSKVAVEMIEDLRLAAYLIKDIVKTDTRNLEALTRDILTSAVNITAIYKSIGGWVGYSLADGVLSSGSLGAVVEAGLILALALEASVRNAAQVHSESPLYNFIGSWIPTSIANGLLSKEGFLNDAGTDLMSTFGSNMFDQAGSWGTAAGQNFGAAFGENLFSVLQTSFEGWKDLITYAGQSGWLTAGYTIFNDREVRALQGNSSQNQTNNKPELIRNFRNEKEYLEYLEEQKELQEDVSKPWWESEMPDYGDLTSFLEGLKESFNLGSITEGLGDLGGSVDALGDSASGASTSVDELTKKIDDLMDRYEDLWEDAKENANKDLFKSVDDQGDDFLDKIQDIMTQYEDIYTSAVERTNGQDLFEEVNDEDESFAPETLMRNLEDQVSQITELNTIIGSLSTRITDENLRAAISNMDVSDLPELRALYRMNASQLSEYEQMYKKKVIANQDKIQNELTGTLSQLTGEYTDVASYVATDASTDQLVKNLQAQIDQLNEYNETVASLMNRISDMNLREAIAHMGVDSLEELKNLNAMTDAQLDAYTEMYNRKIAAEAVALKNELSTELSAVLGEPLDISQFYEAYKQGAVELSSMIKTDSATTEAGRTAGQTLTSGVSSGMKESFSEEEAYQTGKDYTMSLAKGLQDQEAINYLSTTVEGIITMIIEPLNDAHEMFKQCGSESIANAVFEGIDSARMSVEYVEVIEGIAWTFINTINSDRFNDEFYDLGANIVKGLTRGIDQNVPSVASSAAKMASAALQSAKAAVESSSPSRAFMELGKFMDEGLAIGLREYSGLTEEASSEMARSALLAVQEAIQQMSGMLDGSININPVITPTLDLSEVNARSAALANMFTGRQIAIQARNDDQQAEMINQLGNIMAEQNAAPKSITFNQTNNSPKALSRTEIYRQTRNGFSQLANAIS